MSVVLLGDGTITSSIALTTLTLNNPPPLSPPAQFTENVDRLKSDGGVMTIYKKGRRGLIHTLPILWINTNTMQLLLTFFETVDSTNWFTLQDHLILVKTAISHQTLVPSYPKTVIQNYPGTDFNNWFYPKTGLTAFCMSVVGGGGNTGERRRIKRNAQITVPDDSVLVDPGFTNNLQVGDTFLIGIPVTFTSPPKIVPVRHADAFKVELNFEEKIY